MNALLEVQNEFLGYLMDDSVGAVVERIESTESCPAQWRMAIYRNAYRMRLREALATDFERLHAYLGDEYFEDLSDRYIDEYPSHYTSLRHFGSHMVKAVTTMEPFNQWPEVAEIARIELAFGTSFDSADDKPISLEALAAVEATVWPDLGFKFHPSVQLLSLQYNSFQIWQALSNDETPPSKLAQQCDWIIWRQDLVSRYRSLDEAERMALELAIKGRNYATICECLLSFFDEQETPLKALGYLQQWMHDGMVTGLADMQLESDSR